MTKNIHRLLPALSLSPTKKVGRDFVILRQPGHQLIERLSSATAMPPAKKRKTAHVSKAQDAAHVDEIATSKSEDPPHVDKGSEAEPLEDPQPDLESVDKNQERKERFKALQARAVRLLPCTTPV